MTQAVALPARFLARNTAKRELATAVTAGLGMASPPYVSIKGGSFTLVDANGEQEPVETKYLDCVIFDTNLDVPIQRVFWGDAKYNPNADNYQAPACWSDNGVGASAQATQPQSTSCMTCHQNTWGSAVSKVTGKPVKACHAIKKVAVVPIEGKVGPDGTYGPDFTQEFPFLLRVPVMSHDNLRAYGDKFRGQQFDVSDVVTRITFVHGQVGQLDFAAAGFTDQATEDLVQKFLVSKVTDALVGRGDRPWTGALPPPKEEAERAPETVARQVAAPAAQAPATPFAPAQEDTPAPRTRKPRTPRAEPAQAAPPAASPADTGLPPFLQRQQPAAPAAPAQAAIQQAPAPNAELENALANVFGLKT